MTPDRVHGSNLRGIFYMLLAGFAFVANDSLIKLTLAELPGMQILVLRGLAGCLWCLPALYIFGFGKDIASAFKPWVVVRSLFEVVAILCFVQALSHISIGDATAIYQMSPLLVIAGASILWREKINPAQYVLLGLALAGALLVAQPGSSTATIYALWPFGTALAAACRDLASRKIPTSVPGLVVGFSTIVIVMAAALVLHLAAETWVPPTQLNLAAMFGAGFLLLLGHTFVFLAYRHGQAGAVAPFGYSATAWAVISGYLFFSEVPNALSLTGMALITATGLAAIYYEKRRGSPAK